jgi:hypothetical protein
MKTPRRLPSTPIASASPSSMTVDAPLSFENFQHVINLASRLIAGCEPPFKQRSAHSFRHCRAVARASFNNGRAIPYVPPPTVLEEVLLQNIQHMEISA